MCQAAPVATRLMNDSVAWGKGRVWSLGIVRDPGRCAQRRSGHCCGSRAESGNYHPAYAHAWDAGHGVVDPGTADELERVMLADSRTRYTIKRAIGRYPNGGWFYSSGHYDHVHWSGVPGSTFDTRPFAFNGGEDLTIMDNQTKSYLDAKFANLAAGQREHTEQLVAIEGKVGRVRKIARAVANKLGVTKADIDAIKGSD